MQICSIFSERFEIHCMLSSSIQYFFLFFFSGLKLNLTKYKIARTGIPEGVPFTAFGMKCIDLRNEAIKVLGTDLSYNNTTTEESDFLIIVSNVQIC